MFRLIWATAAHIRHFLRMFAPSNILLDLIRTRRGLKWGVPAMLIGGIYFALGYWCTVLIDGGAPGWLHLAVLICIYNGLRFAFMGPVSVVLLIGARILERRADRHATNEDRAPFPKPNLREGSRTGAPTRHEALPHDKYRASHLSRASDAVGA